MAEWLGLSSAAEAATWLVSRDQGELNQAAMDFFGWLKEQGKSPATINLRRAAIKSMLAVARMMGFCLTTLEVKRQREERYRDTLGPDADTLNTMFNDLGLKAAAGSHRAIRDLAIARLLFNRALRKGEVVGLDLNHYDSKGCRLQIHGKARAQREWVTLPSQAVAALEDWLKIRGQMPGPLFIGLHRNGCNDGQRLCARQINRILRAFNIRPHGLRHAAITQALEITNGDTTRVMKFSRHKNVATMMIYDDRRQDIGGQIASLLDAGSATPPAAPKLSKEDYAKLTPSQAALLRSAISLNSVAAAARATGRSPEAGVQMMQTICKRLPAAIPLLNLLSLTLPPRPKAGTMTAGVV